MFSFHRWARHPRLPPVLPANSTRLHFSSGFGAVDTFSILPVFPSGIAMSQLSVRLAATVARQANKVQQVRRELPNYLKSMFEDGVLGHALLARPL